MRRLLLAALAGWSLIGPAAAQGGGRVGVRYVAPERFTDAADRWGSSGRSLRATLADMTRIFQDLADRRLGPDESLDITVLDIDLAGYERPGFGSPTGVRVVQDFTPPRIKLAYVLRRGRRVVASGEDTVSDLNFMLNANPRFATGGLYYERAVLHDWFGRRFPQAAGRG